jgi:hypothetical protein
LKNGLWPGDPCFLFYVLEPAGIVVICLLLCLITFLLAFFFVGFRFFGFRLAMAGPGVATGFRGSSHAGQPRGITFLLAFGAWHRETQTQKIKLL